MGADGSIIVNAVEVTASPAAIVTVADVLRRLEADDGLDERRRREMASASRRRDRCPPCAFEIA